MSGIRNLAAAFPGAVFALDMVIKHDIDKNFPMGRKKRVLGNRVLIHKYYNKGAALNILEDFPGVLRGIHVGIFSCLAGVYVLLLGQRGKTLLKFSLGMVLGGGASNLLDRLTKGYVVDYFSFETPWERVNQIVFNISDLFIFLGTALGCLAGKDV